MNPKKVQINYNNSFATTHSRDYYRGKSFQYDSEWVAGAHYFSDDYNIDFVSKGSVLLACSQSHIASPENEPKDWIYSNEGHIIGVVSQYWDFVLAGNAGKDGKIYKPEYDAKTGILSWTLVPNDADETVNFDLKLTDVINQAVAKANQAAAELSALKTELESTITSVTSATTDARSAAINASNIANQVSSKFEQIENTFNSMVVQETGEQAAKVMSQKATTDAISALESNLTDSINTIQSKMSSDATSSNKLVDKDYVDSEIDSLHSEVQNKITLDGEMLIIS